MSQESEAPLSLSDCRCNICMEIFLEPVTLPCHHTLCNSCFQLTVEKASLCCPFCRRRVSSWARYNARRNTLVNSDLWEKIKKYFPEECQRRIDGQALEEDACIPQPVRCLSKPGELRQEYEAEITKVEAERRAHEQEESKASEDYIQRLLAEEEQEQKLAEERKKQIAEQLLQDEILAQQLSFSLNSCNEEHNQSGLSPGPSPSNSCRTSKNKSSNTGGIEKYLSPKTCSAVPPNLLFKTLEEESISSFYGENSSTKNGFAYGKEGREDEMPTLSPQAVSEAINTEDSILGTSMPHLNVCNAIASKAVNLDLSCPSHYQVNDLANKLSNVTQSEETETGCLFSKSGAACYDFKNANVTGSMHLTKHAKINTSHEALVSVTSDNQQSSCVTTCDLLKTMGNNPVENDHSGSLITEAILKRKSQSSPDTTFESFMGDKRRRTFLQSDDDEETDIQKQISLQKQLYERYKQEEEDRLIALNLQKQMDKEQKMLNRKKGSPDEYHLRPKKSLTAKEAPVVKKHCKLSKNAMPSISRTGVEQQKVRKGSHNENRKPSYKVWPKSPIVKGGNVLNCVLNSSKDPELLPNKQKTILQMFKKSSTK
ncbi:E3 ubiquitin-protein ligase RNF168 [Tiliqua scincoides]|uniref:E3 ubiquitin-protein ligase RNF168 n=1 Tax=Tiliqua scincoides TaxID=71010 RepID=UPI0034631537